MLGYLGAYEQQLRGEVAKLAGWPRRTPREARDVLRGSPGIRGRRDGRTPGAHGLGGVRGTLGCIAHPGRMGTSRGSARRPGAIEPVVAGALADRAFSCVDAAAASPMAFVPEAGGRLRSWPGVPLHARLRGGIRDPEGARSATQGRDASRLALLSRRRRLISDDLVVGEIVAQQVTARLEHFYLLQRMQQSAVMEERVRLARDLHDGLLQSLTGTALQLHALRHALSEQPPETLERLQELQNLVVTEQRHLRSFISDLRPNPLLPAEEEGDLTTSLRNLVHRIERHWGLRVELVVAELDARDMELPPTTSHTSCTRRS